MIFKLFLGVKTFAAALRLLQSLLVASAAEQNNAENLLRIQGPALFKKCIARW